MTDVVANRQTVSVDHFEQPEEFRDYFKACFEPTIAIYNGIADDPDRVAALDGDLAELARRHAHGTGTMGWEYLLLTARKPTKSAPSRPAGSTFIRRAGPHSMT